MRHLPKDIGNMEKYKAVATAHNLQDQGLLRFDGRDTMKFECIAAGLNMDDHWVFVNDMVHENCLLQWDILHRKFGLIPSYCQKQCWKICIKCRTLYEMMQVHEIMTDLGLYGKVGVDERDYTAGIYNAFIYNKSHDEGKKNYQAIVPVIIEQVGHHFKQDWMHSIILKRGCTEMEMQLQSSQWQVTEDITRQEGFVDNIIKTPDDLKNFQPEWLVEYKVFRWCAKASSLGDFSFREVPKLAHLIFHVRSQTYHQKEWIDGEET